MAKKRKQVLDVKKVVITAGIFILLIVLIVALIIFFNGKNKKDKYVNESFDYMSAAQSEEGITVELADCSLYVGTELSISCTSNPAEYASQAIWTSSNSDVISVDSKGNITVKAVGTAAVTATYGIWSDSVIINAIEKGTKVENTDLPVYEVVDGQTVAVTDEGTGDDTGNGTTDPDAGTNADGTQVTTAANSTDPSENTSQPTNSAGEIETEAESRAEIESTIEDFGFTLYINDDSSNTYTYSENGNYLGQVIMDDSKMLIYVMTRTSGFDKSLKSLLQSILPTGYENVYANFVSATSDQTMNADGYKVRIVAATNGDHAQIIIYY